MLFSKLWECVRSRKVKVAQEYLKKVSVAILQSLGAKPEEAELVSRNLLMAEMRGIHTHGVNFIPKVADRVEKGVMNIPTEIKFLSNDGATCHIDGNNGFGQVAATEGMKRAIAHARVYGIGTSLIRNTNHIGLLAFYSAMAAEEGMIGFAMCNGAPSIAPWGGAEAFFGTNPFSVAAPVGERYPVVLDMSTSLVARGKIRRALKLDEKIGRDWALDGEGKPTEDPARALEGTLLPVGGPKGYGMAFFIDLVCGLLSGSKFSRDILTFHKPLGPTGVGSMLLAFDITRFMELETFHTLAKSHIENIRKSKKAEGVDRIYLPGEIEFEAELKSLREGVEIDEPTAKELEELLRKQGIDLELRQQN